MSELIKACEKLVSKLKDIESTWPKIVTRESVNGAELDLAGVKLLLKSFDKDLSGNVKKLLDAKAEKVAERATAVKQIVQGYQSNIEKAKDGFMAWKAVNALDVLLKSADKAIKEKQVSKENAEIIKQHISIWSKVKEVQQQILEKQAGERKKQIVEIVKGLKGGFAQFQKIDVDAVVTVVKNWSRAEPEKKKKLALTVKEKVDQVIAKLSDAIDNQMNLTRYSSELFVAYDKALVKFRDEFRKELGPIVASNVLAASETAGKTGFR